VKLDWADFGEDAAPATIERSIITAGFHWGEIKIARINEGWKITDRNPSGNVLSVAVDFSTEGKNVDFVWTTIPANWTGKILEVIRCANMEEPKRGESEFDEANLVGRRVYCECETFVLEQGKNAGTERGKIVQWVKPERQPKQTETTQERRARHDENEIVAKPQKQRSKAQPAKQTTPEWESDDIPF
jgi:hypothetical protein